MAVHDEVNVQFFGHALLDGIEEAAELFGAMTLLVLAYDLASLGFQRGKQAGRAAPRRALHETGTRGLDYASAYTQDDKVYLDCVIEVL